MRRRDRDRGLQSSDSPPKWPQHLRLGQATARGQERCEGSVGWPLGKCKEKLTRFHLVPAIVGVVQKSNYNTCYKDKEQREP